MANALHHECTVVRTVLIEHHSLELATGKMTPTGSEWVTKACGIPLFGNDTAAGICRGCTRGWNHPDNYRADGPRPTEVVNEAPAFKPISSLSALEQRQAELDEPVLEEMESSIERPDGGLLSNLPHDA